MVAVLSLLPHDIALGAVAANSKASSGSSSQTGDQTILFVDDNAILYRSGTRRVIQQPERHAANPVIGETKPWEVAIGYCCLLYTSDAADE